MEGAIKIQGERRGATPPPLTPSLTMPRSAAHPVWALKALVSVTQGPANAAAEAKTLRFLWVAWGRECEETHTFEPLQTIYEDCPELYRDFKSRVNSENQNKSLSADIWAEIAKREFLIYAASSSARCFENLDLNTVKCHTAITPSPKRKAGAQQTPQDPTSSKKVAPAKTASSGSPVTAKVSPSKASSTEILTSSSENNNSDDDKPLSAARAAPAAAEPSKVSA